MDKLIAQFPKQLCDALEIAEKKDFSYLQEERFQHVLIAGMGGSGIGGKLCLNWFSKNAKTPIYLNQHYEIPGFVNRSTLFLASSYSGNTEEVLHAVKEAARRGAKIIGITSGGELEQFCKSSGYDYVKIPGGQPPRSMLAFSLLQLISILNSAGIIQEDLKAIVDQTKSLLSRELIEIKTQAKKLAQIAYRKSMVIYATQELEAVAIRGRQQFNENAKQLCSHHIIPEMNHNEVVGWGSADENNAALFITSPFVHERDRKRWEICQEIVRGKTTNILTIEGKGSSLILSAFYLIHILDWASFFLSEQNKVDVFEIKVIDYLKSQLAK
jgi:glucose/mannose-6-phosphate isomerase